MSTVEYALHQLERLIEAGSCYNNLVSQYQEVRAKLMAANDISVLKELWGFDEIEDEIKAILNHNDELINESIKESTSNCLDNVLAMVFDMIVDDAIDYRKEKGITSISQVWNEMTRNEKLVYYYSIVN